MSVFQCKVFVHNFITCMDCFHGFLSISKRNANGEWNMGTLTMHEGSTSFSFTTGTESYIRNVGAKSLMISTHMRMQHFWMPSQPMRVTMGSKHEIQGHGNAFIWSKMCLGDPAMPTWTTDCFWSFVHAPRTSDKQKTWEGWFCTFRVHLILILIISRYPPLCKLTPVAHSVCVTSTCHHFDNEVVKPIFGTRYRSWCLFWRPNLAKKGLALERPTS